MSTPETPANPPDRDDQAADDALARWGLASVGNLVGDGLLDDRQLIAEDGQEGEVIGGLLAGAGLYRSVRQVWRPSPSPIAYSNAVAIGANIASGSRPAGAVAHVSSQSRLSWPVSWLKRP